MTKYDLVVVGDLVADIILPVSSLPLRPNEHGWADGLFVELGGSCTTLVAARRVELQVAALGILGDDEYGRQVVQMLADEGVDVSEVAMYAGRQTVLCVVVTDKAGEHVFLGIKDNRPAEPVPERWLDVIRRSRSVYTTGYALRDLLQPDDVLHALRTARSFGTTVFFDPGPSIAFLERELLADVLVQTDVLLLTEEEATFLGHDGAPEEVARALLGLGPQVVVLKAGSAGCYIAAEEQVSHQPGFDVKVVDTVGAGDAFVAAFVAAYLRGGSWRECGAVASAMGAAVASTRGAGRRVPPLSRVLELVADDPAARLVRPNREVR